MILLVHPTGNTFSRALLAALLERGKLGLFATTIAMTGKEPWLQLFPEPVLKQLLRRKFDVPRDKLFQLPGPEVLRLVTQRVGLGDLTFDVYSDVDKAVAGQLRRFKRKNNLTTVYAYEDGALGTFRAARELALRRVYDLPIAYWNTTQRLLREEAERLPAWAQTMTGLSDSPEKLARKTEEAQLADVIICPSDFVRASLPRELQSRSIVAEFGSPSRATPPPFRKPGAKLRVLFAGSMSQRKGLADVFAAMKLLRRADVELVVIGSAIAPMSFYREQFADFVYEPTRPHDEVLALMETCDVLVLPSIVEGRALVQQEAMTSGLVLIATANAGGQDLIEERRTGFLVPIRSPEKIAEKLNWLADHRDSLPEMKRAAYEKAAALTWASYSDKILHAIAHAHV